MTKDRTVDMHSTTASVTFNHTPAEQPPSDARQPLGVGRLMEMQSPFDLLDQLKDSFRTNAGAMRYVSHCIGLELI